MSCPTAFEIGEYVDRALPAEAHGALKAHLTSCAHCRALDADLRSIQSLARALEPMAVPPQVWPRIAARLGPPRRTWWWPDHVAWRMLPATAAAALVVTSLGWLAGALTRPDVRLAGVTAEGNTARVDPRSEFQRADAELTSAIAGLERIAGDERRSLDPAVADLLTSTLTVIDGAIGESRLALAAEPDSDLVQDTLFDALTHKMTLLEDAVALMTEARIDLDRDAATTTPVNP